MLKGTTIKLFEKTQTGTDPFGAPVYEEAETEVENVLIAPVNGEEQLDELNLTGRRAVYQLAIPKGDAHEWTNRIVEFFGERWRVIGTPVQGMDELIPLDWNLKVKVESIVGEEG